MKDKFFKVFFLVQERITKKGSGGKFLERRINPYNPIVHITLVVSFLIHLLVEVSLVLHQLVKSILSYKEFFEWGEVEALPVKLISKVFDKEANGEWYIHLPEYIDQGGTKADLQMVGGADTLLDILSQREDKVRVTFSREDFHGCEYQLDLMRIEESVEEEDWGIYRGTPVDSEVYPEIETVMLCPVTKFVFDWEFPSKIYIR